MGQIFTFLHLIFDIDKAQKLSKNYTSEQHAPSLDWLLPLVYIDPLYVTEADLLKNVIFAQLPMNGTLCNYLIDGNHTVKRAIAESSLVNVIYLSVSDSLKILKSKKHIRDSLAAEARKLGLI